MDTEVYQFRNPSNWLSRQARTNDPGTWRTVSNFAFHIGWITALAVFMLAVVWVLYIVPSTFYDERPLWTLMAGATLIPFTAAALGLSYLAERKHISAAGVRNGIHKGRYRSYYVTSKHFSFQVIHRGEDGYTFSADNTPRMQSALYAFYADNSVIKADRVIRRTRNTLKGVEKRYKAKLVILKAAEKVYACAPEARTEVLAELKEEITRKRDQRLTNIKNKAAHKVLVAEQLLTRR